VNTPAQWTDEQIHAFVDGELDADSAARLEGDSQADPALTARVERQRRLRDRLQARFATVLDEPVPRRLQELLPPEAAAANVTALESARSARSPRRRWALPEWGAIAAALVLGTVLGPQLFRDASLPFEHRQGSLTASGYLDAALTTQAGGAAGQAMIGLTFRAGNGQYCRTFDLRSGGTGLACRRGERWIIELLEGGGAEAGTPEYRTAGSAITPAMLEVVTRLGAEAALTPEEEQQARAARWNAAPDTP
jgi:hypothetical protein